MGAGFGGLGAALALAERGARVVVVEALKYPGGCASTFTRHGDRFESGATLFSGFGDGQLFARLIARHRMNVRAVAIDPIVELRGPSLTLPIPATREALVERLCAIEGAPREGIRAFFATQRHVADALWPLFDDPTLLPPLSLSSVLRHAGRLGAYAHVLPLLGRPLLDLLEKHGVARFSPLRTFVDAVCQITVQAPAREAEAPLALAALDYFFRGTRHVEGGVGELAWAMAHAIEAAGGTTSFADRAHAIEQLDGAWIVRTRKQALRAPLVFANVLPRSLMELCASTPPESLRALSTAVQAGWSAMMRYLVVDGIDRREAHHLELVANVDEPFIEGNHLFCSISAADEARTRDRLRTVTISTHVEPRDDAAYANDVQRAIDATLALRAPELVAATLRSMTASPRTFERFTSRPGGVVGGVPRRHGLHNYRGLTPKAVWPGLFLVGDSVFPGQSTLAAVLGGYRAVQVGYSG